MLDHSKSLINAPHLKREANPGQAPRNAPWPSTAPAARQGDRMARKSDIYRSPPFDAALAGGIGEADGNRSRRVAHVCDRYLEILRRADLPAFSEAEWGLLREVLSGIPREPASNLRGLWHRVHDAAEVGRLTERWTVDGPDLINRLKLLSYVQEVALIEKVEEWAARGGDGDASAA